MTLHSCTFTTPLGDMLAVASPAGLCLLEFVGQKGLERELAQVQAARGTAVQAGASPILAQTRAEVAEYFAGRRQGFGVALDLVGTAFQLAAWQALLAERQPDNLDAESLLAQWQLLQGIRLLRSGSTPAQVVARLGYRDEAALADASRRWLGHDQDAQQSASR